MKRLLPFLLLVLCPALAEAQATFSAFVSETPTVDTAAYATGDLIGTKLEFENALREVKGSGFITGIVIADKGAQTADLDLVIFSSDPSSTTFTDNAAFDIADADLSKIVRVVHFTSTNRFSFADNMVHELNNQLLAVRALDANGSTNSTLYGALISRGTPDFVTAGDVTITIGISQD